MCSYINICIDSTFSNSLHMNVKPLLPLPPATTGHPHRAHIQLRLQPVVSEAFYYSARISIQLPSTF